MQQRNKHGTLKRMHAFRYRAKKDCLLTKQNANMLQLRCNTVQAPRKLLEFLQLLEAA